MREQFTQFTWYKDNFGFLYNVGKLKYMDDELLMNHCKDLQILLTDGSSRDFDAVDMYSELIIF